MDDIRNGAFGPLAAHCYTIEFQKRGLPHAHMLFILADEEDARVENIDRLIAAEIPDRNTQKELYGTVTRCMIHGPCKPDDTCMRDGKCTKGFPKEFCAETVIGKDCYPHYRRRRPGIDGGRGVTTIGQGWTKSRGLKPLGRPRGLREFRRRVIKYYQL